MRRIKAQAAQGGRLRCCNGAALVEPDLSFRVINELDVLCLVFGGFIQIDKDDLRAVLARRSLAHVVDDHPAHDRRRDGEEVPAVLPGNRLLPVQALVGFVRQIGCAQGETTVIAADLRSGQRMQGRVDALGQRVPHRAVARLPRFERFGDGRR